MIPASVVTRLGKEGFPLEAETFQPASGGCIHRALLGEDTSGRLLFLKLNDASRHDLFVGEKRGLELLRATATIRVPAPLATGIEDGIAYLLLEGLSLRGGGGPGGDEAMGERIAALHDWHPPEPRFGEERDNHIGATPQPNGWYGSWAEFFVERRLRHQFALANTRGGGFSDATVTRCLAVVRDVLVERDPSPSLLHGDLWGGNAAFLDEGEPVVFDPAAYFGDGEADIAFTRMFGGFGPGFYRAYRTRHPAPAGVERLHAIYNLYHLLNHFVLFGGGYAESAKRTMREIAD